jgi:hypothetical protein
VPIVLKYGTLNLLEPSEPVKACNGIGLPLINVYLWLATVIYCLVSDMYYLPTGILSEKCVVR